MNITINNIDETCAFWWLDICPKMIQCTDYDEETETYSFDLKVGVKLVAHDNIIELTYKDEIFNLDRCQFTSIRLS